MSARILLMCFCLLMAAPYQSQALTPFEVELSEEQQLRYRELIHQLRCLVCQNQTIADSDAELAADLRRQVHDRILAGESNEQIKAYVTARYGDFVLYKPPMSARTVLLWIGPAVLVLFGLITVWRFSRRPKESAPVRDLDRERLHKLLDEDS